MDDNSCELEIICFSRLLLITESGKRIGCDVKRIWEVELIVDFCSQSCHDVVIEAFEIEDQIIGYVFETSALHSVHMTSARGTRVFVLTLENFTFDVRTKAVL